MYVDFLTEKKISFNKEDVKSEADYKVITELVAMLCSIHNVSSGLYIEDLKKIVQSNGAYTYQRKFVTLNINSLDTTVEVEVVERNLFDD